MPVAQRGCRLHAKRHQSSRGGFKTGRARLLPSQRRGKPRLGGSLALPNNGFETLLVTVIVVVITDGGGFIAADQDIGFRRVLVRIFDHVDLALPLVIGAAKRCPFTGGMTYVPADPTIVNGTEVFGVGRFTDRCCAGHSQPAASTAIHDRVVDRGAPTLLEVLGIASPAPTRLAASRFDSAHISLARRWIKSLQGGGVVLLQHNSGQ